MGLIFAGLNALGGTLSSQKGAVVGENGGRTVVNLIDTTCTAGSENAISASGNSAGILTVNLWDTQLAGNIECAEGCSVTVNLYAGGKLTGEVTGSGEVAINVFEGGEYNGSFQAASGATAEEKPVLGSFDDYLISCWASGSSTWTESRAKNYAENVEPQILENSASCHVTEGASAKPYDPAVYNPSENGVDLSLLNVGGAHGFTVDEIFGGMSAKTGGKPDGAKKARPTSDSALDVILNAGTTQAFTDEAIPEEDLEKILQAGLAAPSAINQQPWFFAAITNPEIVKEITGGGTSADAPASETPDAGNADNGEGPSGGMPAGDFSGSDGAPAGGDFGGSDGAPAGGDFGGSDGGSSGASAGGTSAKAGFGDSPVAIVLYKNGSSMSPNADFDCGLAAQNMVIAAVSLGYGAKIVSSPTGTLNGANHDAICEKLGVDPSLQAVAVLLIGRPDEDLDAVSSASTRDGLETKTTIVK